MDNYLQTLMTAAQSMSPWEASAVVFAIAYLLLAVKENIWCWLFALLSTAIYTVLFWDVSLLMESALNIYYMAMAIYGWHQWTRGGVSSNENPRATQTTVMQIRSMTGKQHMLIIFAILLLSGLSGYLLSENSTAAWPYVDSFTTWASVITTWMVTQKYLQNWLYWLVIDTVSIPLYIDRGLNLTALLFVFYVIIAVFGYLKWYKHFHSSRQVVAA